MKVKFIVNSVFPVNGNSGMHIMLDPDNRQAPGKDELLTPENKVFGDKQCIGAINLLLQDPTAYCQFKTGAEVWVDFEVVKPE